MGGDPDGIVTTAVNDIHALHGNHGHIPIRIMLWKCLFGADIDAEMGVDPEGDSGDEGIDGYYYYY